MVKCSFCNRNGVYASKASGKIFCDKHFLKYFDKKVRKTIREYRLFRREEKIVVAVSGGKDSLSLLQYLVKLSERAPRWNISALLIDEGISRYREYTKKDFINLVEDLRVNYRIVSFKSEIGLTLDEIVERGKDRLPYLPCTYCGVFRRYLLNKYAREMNGTVLATAHNLDDIIQTFLMNVMKNSWDKIARLGPVSGVTRHPKFVRRVKPFFGILEKETTLYAVLNGIYPSEAVECPYAPLSFRWCMRNFLNKIEEKNPGTKYAILSSMLQILPLIKEKYREEKLNTCKICGEPSSQEKCRTCIFLEQLNISL